LADAWNQLASLYGRRNQFAEADEAYARLAVVLDSVPESERNAPRYRHDRAALLLNTGWRFAQQQKYAEARRLRDKR
jgi:hypothetical protein